MNKTLRLVLFALIGLVIAYTYQNVDVHELKTQVAQFTAYIHAKGVAGMLVFVATHAAAVAVCFPATIACKFKVRGAL
jgi:uncharacterized membrane protein YdjX (TVP38/TMEM64 family)